MQEGQDPDLEEQREGSAVQEQAACQDGLSPVQERGDSPMECSPPWALLPPSTPPDPHIADGHSSGGSCASQGADTRHKLQLLEQQIQMLIGKLIKAEEKVKLGEEQNVLLLQKHDKDQAQIKYIVLKNDELTQRIQQQDEQLVMEKERMEQETARFRAETERLQQQYEELQARLMLALSQGPVASQGQAAALEEEEEELSSCSSVLVNHSRPAFTALPLQSPDALTSIQTGFSLPVQAGEDNSATDCKGQQDGGGVIRHRRSGPRHFTIERRHLQCDTCNQFFSSELTAKQVPCTFHQRKAVKVPFKFWAESHRSPGSLGSSQLGQQNGQTPMLLLWPCCERIGCKAKPCCTERQHKFNVLHSKS